MTNRKRGIYNLIFSIMYKIAVMGIGLIIPRLFILNYGSELNGFQSTVGQIFTYIALIEAGVGEATLQALYKPIAKNEYKDVNEILSASTYYYNKIGLFYFIILFVVAIVYPMLVTLNAITYWSAVSYIVLSGSITGISFFYTAKIGLVINAVGDNYWSTIIQFVVYVLSSTIKIFCIMAGYSIVIIQAGYLCINLLYTLVLYIFAKKRYPWISFNCTPNLKAIQQKNSVLLHKISGIVFQNTDILILSFFCDFRVVSIYTVYKMVVSSITSIISTLTGSFTFSLGQTFAINKHEYCRKIDMFNVVYQMLAFILIAVTYILYEPFIMLYTKGSDIQYVDMILPQLFVAIEVLMFAREAMMITITVAGHFKQTLWRSLVESAINLFVSLVFVNLIGIYGVLLGTIVALLYRTIDINYYANRKILSRSPIKTFCIFGLNCMILGAIIILKRIIPFEISDYRQFIISGGLLTLASALLYVTINSIFFYNDLKPFARVIM